MKKHIFATLALGIVAGLSLSTQIVLADSIHPISREMGSGTRSAFVEIFGIQKEVKGKKIDATTIKAEVTNSTGVMMTSIANSKNAIGYISLGSLNDTIKALKIDGIAPSVENINNKSYKVSRPFNVVTKAGVDSELAQDFLTYAVGAREIIQKAGYIVDSKAKAVESKKPSGKLIIAGSSSVTPLMEKLAESYKSVNPNATLEILQSDSTTGINSVLDGIADIGMVSRELKDTEVKKGLKVQVLATDGLAVIVNKNNALDSLSKEQVKKVFMGEITDWEEVK